MSRKNLVLIVAVIVIIGAIFYIESKKPEQSDLAAVEAENVASVEEKDTMYEKAKEITTPDGFINTDEISVGELIGEKIVLIDFWTYSCINCQRTIPYLNAWYEKYQDQGLEILAIHTPEFEFEEDYNNVLQAVNKFGIEYPVILDNDYSTWRAYRNRYWPRKYLIDIDGYIVYDHIGEGAYKETEKVIQELLKERAEKLGTDEIVSEDISNPEGAVDITKRSGNRSPETYFGASRNERLSNGVPGATGEMAFQDPEMVNLNSLYLTGTWNIHEEYAESVSNSAVIYDYVASDVFIVMSSPEGVSKVRVKRNGEAIPREIAGEDIKYDREGSYFEVMSDSLYKIIEGDDPAVFHSLDLDIEQAGVRAFAFTFG